MRRITSLLVLPLLIAACSPTTRTIENNTVKADSATSAGSGQSLPKELFATMSIKSTISVGDSVKLKFTVYNTSDSTQQFCKWHTPFEPLMSKYLDVKDQFGAEADYRGAMAKRIMPPPAESYVKVKPGDSLSVDVDVLKAYAITKPAKYSIVYNAQAISGLMVKDSVSFNYIKP